MLTIWGRANSINVQKVLWCCAELGLAYRRIDAGREFGLTDTPDYRARNPNGLVPTMEEDGFVLWEANVIVRYLAAKHATGSLYPDDLRLRFDVERWMDWQVTTLWPALRPVFFGLTRTPPEQRDGAAIEEARQASGKAFAILDRLLADRLFIGGEAFTMGDIPLGITAYRWFELDIRRPDLPALDRWYERLKQRPAFRTHVMQPLS